MGINEDFEELLYQHTNCFIVQKNTTFSFWAIFLGIYGEKQIQRFYLMRILFLWAKTCGWISRFLQKRNGCNLWKKLDLSAAQVESLKMEYISLRKILIQKRSKYVDWKKRKLEKVTVKKSEQSPFCVWNIFHGTTLNSCTIVYQIG